MVHISKKIKQLLKWIFVLVICGAIFYTFRDLAVPIYKELRKTSVLVVALICLSACVYELIEGWITMSFAKTYNPHFTYWQGVQSAFYCSFYRVATLGSGTGIAAVYFFHEKGVEYSKGTGMYTIEYMIHKVSIAVFAVIFLFLNWRFVLDNFSQYSWALIGGFILTGIITVMLLLVCCSEKIHRLIIWLLGKLNRKGRFDREEAYVKEQIAIFEEASKDLLNKKSRILAAVLKNLLKLVFWYGIPFLILYNTTNLTLSQVLAVTSLSVMLAAVIPAPAGIGSTELVFTMLYALLIGTGQAGSISLLYRFATFVVPFLVGGVLVLIRRRNARKIAVMKEA